MTMRLGLRVLLSLATALAVLVLLELRVGTGPGPAITDAGRVATAVEPNRQDAAPEATVAERLALVLGRPMFTPGRRPVQLGPAATEMPRLSGIVHGPSLRLAIFAVPDDGHRSMLRSIGDRVAGWRIARIDPDRVVLVRNDLMLQLRPRYDVAHAVAPVPVPISQIVVLSQKHTNPQLAW